MILTLLEKIRVKVGVSSYPTAGLIDLLARVDDPVAKFLGLRSAFEALRPMGDFEGLAVHAEAGLAAAERMRQADRVERALHFSTVVAYHDGNWQAARTFSDRGLEARSGTPPLGAGAGKDMRGSLYKYRKWRLPHPVLPRVLNP